MKTAITSIIGAAFNIIMAITNAFHLETASQILVQIAPEVNIIAIAVLFFFGIESKQKAAS